MAAISVRPRESRRNRAPRELEFEGLLSDIDRELAPQRRYPDIHYLSTGFINGTRISFMILRRGKRFVLIDDLKNTEQVWQDTQAAENLWDFADHYLKTRAFHRANRSDESPGGDVGVTRIFYDDHKYAAAPDDVPILSQQIKQLMRSVGSGEPVDAYSEFLQEVDRKVKESFLYNELNKPDNYDDDEYDEPYEDEINRKNMQDIDEYRFKNLRPSIRNASVGRYIFDNHYEKVVEFIVDSAVDESKDFGLWFYEMIEEWGESLQDYEDKEFQTNVLTLVLARLPLTASIRYNLDYMNVVLTVGSGFVGERDKAKLMRNLDEQRLAVENE